MTGVNATLGIAGAQHGRFVDVVALVGGITYSIVYDWNLEVV